MQVTASPENANARFGVKEDRQFQTVFLADRRFGFCRDKKLRQLKERRLQLVRTRESRTWMPQTRLVLLGSRAAPF
jgi:hypothetical protein